MITIEIEEWLEMAKEVLVREDFRHTALQVVKPGQVFGLVRKEDDVWEMHVRGFDNGRLESEIEISRDYFEHLDDRFRRDATLELKEILDAYQVPCSIEGDISHSTVVLPYPEGVTPWKPLAVVGGIAILLACLARVKRAREKAKRI